MRASVIIDNHNYAEFLPAAIESALGQTTSAEVIVVDDGSTDRSRDVITEYEGRVRAVLKPNGGQASALNAGFEASAGDVVCFLDADDLLAPTAMEAAIEALASTEAVKAHWPLWLIDRDGVRSGELAPRGELCCGDLRDLVTMRGPGSHSDPPTSGNAWRRGYLESVLPIPLEYRSCADAYLLELAPLFGPIARLPAPQGSYRLHGENGCAGMSFDDRIRHELTLHERNCDAVAAACLRLGIAFDRADWCEDHWSRDLAHCAADIASAVPPGEAFVLVDEDKLSMDGHAGRDAVPFPERDGIYWGRPADDAAAVAELERQRERGLRYMVFAWTAFWWLV